MLEEKNQYVVLDIERYKRTKEQMKLDLVYSKISSRYRKRNYKIQRLKMSMLKDKNEL